MTPVSSQTYRAEEVRRQPGAQEDVLRAISVAPGVGVTSGARNDLVVRGGAPFENLFVVDNIEVPNINHFGSQGSTGGPISLINIRFIESVTLSTVRFGARYGDRASSATSLTLREGNRERVAGELNVAATQVGAVLEGPIGQQASFFVNVRQSYLDLLFKAIGLSFIPSYSDVTRQDRLASHIAGCPQRTGDRCAWHRDVRRRQRRRSRVERAGARTGAGPVLQRTYLEAPAGQWRGDHDARPHMDTVRDGTTRHTAAADLREPQH